jgi:hypothetical protein
LGNGVVKAAPVVARAGAVVAANVAIAVSTRGLVRSSMRPFPSPAQSLPPRRHLGPSAERVASDASKARNYPYNNAPRTSPPKVPSSSRSLDELSRAAAAPDRGGYTSAGRSLTKHGAGARAGSKLFPAAKGSPAEINRQAQTIVDDILTTPGTTISNGYRGRWGKTTEVTAPDGRGIVYDANGKFLFFKE